MDAYWRAADYLSVGLIYLYDNPGRVVACVIGDGEAETGPLATAWHSNKFLNPVTDGGLLLSDLKIRVINVVDLMKRGPDAEHPHGLSDQHFDTLFTINRPIVFAFHGYPWLIHRLTCHRTNHHNIHVRGYKEEGAITTTFDMTAINDLDRFHLVQDVIHRPPQLSAKSAGLEQMKQDKLIDHKQYMYKYGRDMPEIRNWNWV